MGPATDLQHQFYDMLMQSQYWPAERMLAYQRSQLEQLLRHARKNVPFYETRLDPVFRPNGDIDWDRWGEIPIVRRGDLERPESMRARELPEGHGRVFHAQTSGSTGTQVDIAVNALMRRAARTANFRALSWHNLNWSLPLGSWRGGDPAVGAWPEGRDRGRWGPRWMAAATGQFLELNRAADDAQALEFFGRKGSRYLLAGATDVRQLAHESERLGVSFRFDAVLTRSADITDEGRALVRRVFGAPVISHYGSTEAHKIAHPCEAGHHYHVNAELVFLEVLDDDDLPCATGETGRVILTPLYSTAQPLIRYDQGDLAVVGARCSCGRTLPVLERLVGRVKSMFVAANGRRLAPWLSPGVAASIGARMWQLAQTGLREIELRYVPDGEDRCDRALVTAAIHDMMHDAVQVRFVPIADFAVPRTRKHVEYVSELPAHAEGRR